MWSGVEKRRRGGYRFIFVGRARVCDEVPEPVVAGLSGGGNVQEREHAQVCWAGRLSVHIVRPAALRGGDVGPFWVYIPCSCS